MHFITLWHFCNFCKLATLILKIIYINIFECLQINTHIDLFIYLP